MPHTCRAYLEQSAPNQVYLQLRSYSPSSACTKNATASLCLQLCIKVFSALFVCVRRSGAGCLVLRVVSTTMGSAGLGLRLAREEETEVLAVSLCGPAHTNGDLARDGVSKRLLRRAAPCRRPKIRTWRRPPAHGMQQAASATSATPRSTTRSPLATRGVAGLFRQQGRGVQANETQVRGTEVEGADGGCRTADQCHQAVRGICGGREGSANT